MLTIKLFTRVNSCVKSESLFHRKSFITNLAFIWHLTRVSSHVNSQGTNLNKLLTTNPTLVRLFSRVFSRVFLHVIFPAESLTTEGTRKLFSILTLLQKANKYFLFCFRSASNCMKQLLSTQMIRCNKLGLSCAKLRASLNLFSFD